MGRISTDFNLIAAIYALANTLELEKIFIFALSKNISQDEKL